MARSRSMTRAQRTSRHAAVLVDYADLHALLTDRLAPSQQAHTYIAEALSELHRYLADEDGTSTVLTAAYADFGALGDRDLQQKLYHQGVEPRFAPSTPDACAAQIQLAVDATTLLHERPDVETVALVTGARPYLPLVQALRREGAHAFVAALDPPPPGELTHADHDAFMDFLNLLGDAARRDLLQSGEMTAREPQQHGGAPSSAATGDSAPAGRLDDDMLFRTLEIAEEHFGQYDEVYLTPLLRKLSDVLGERFDPKVLVSDLEDAGAVRLEKRRGYPYDYTVLIVERDHPDVQKMEEQFYDDDPSRHERSGSSAVTAASLDDTSGYNDRSDEAPDGRDEDTAEDDDAAPTAAEPTAAATGPDDTEETR